MPIAPPRHRAQPPAKQHGRSSPSQRGYNRTWQRLAAWHRGRHPLCADPFGLHDGRPTPGEHVDHVVPLSAGGTNEDANLQTLCASCHSRKTVQCDGGFGRARQTMGGDVTT